MDDKFKDLLDDEELTALRLQALATKRKKEEAEASSNSSALPINSIITNESTSNHIPFVQTDRNVYNNHSWRKQNHPSRRRGGAFPQKSNQRSNLIVINPVAEDGGKNSSEKAPLLMLPQHKWCNSGNEDSMSPKTLRRTGPTRFNRHGSDSESSDSDFENSENDSESNETVLQDEPEHFSHLSPKDDTVPDTVEKKRRLSFQNLDSEIQSDEYEKNEATSVYKCMKKSALSQDLAKSQIDSFTTTQNISDNRHDWNSSVGDDYSSYKQYNNSYAPQNGETHHESDITVKASDTILQQSRVNASNSYYTSDVSSTSENLRNHKLKFSRDSEYSQIMSENGRDNNALSREKLLSGNDLRLELKKRMQDIQSKPTNLENFNDFDGEKQSYHCSQDRNENRNVYGEDRSEFSYKDLYGNEQDLNSMAFRNRVDQRFCVEKNQDNLNFNKKSIHQRLGINKNKRDNSSSIDGKRNESDLSSVKNKYDSGSDLQKSESDIKLERTRSERSSSKDRRERSSSFERKRWERSSSHGRSRRGRSSSFERIRHDRSSSSERNRRDRSSSLARNRRDRSSSLSRNRRDRSSSLSRNRRDRSLSLSRNRRDRSSSLSRNRRDRSSSLTRNRRDRSLSLARNRRDRSSSLARNRLDRSSSHGRSRYDRSSSRGRHRQEQSASQRRNRHECSISPGKVKPERRSSQEKRQEHILNKEELLLKSSFKNDNQEHNHQSSQSTVKCEDSGAKIVDHEEKKRFSPHRKRYTKTHGSGKGSHKSRSSRNYSSSDRSSSRGSSSSVSRNDRSVSRDRQDKSPIQERSWYKRSQSRERRPKHSLNQNRSRHRKSLSGEKDKDSIINHLHKRSSQERSVSEDSRSEYSPSKHKKRLKRSVSHDRDELSHNFTQGKSEDEVKTKAKHTQNLSEIESKDRYNSYQSKQNLCSLLKDDKNRVDHSGHENVDKTNNFLKSEALYNFENEKRLTKSNPIVFDEQNKKISNRSPEKIHRNTSYSQKSHKRRDFSYKKRYSRSRSGSSTSCSSTSSSLSSQSTRPKLRSVQSVVNPVSTKNLDTSNKDTSGDMKHFGKDSTDFKFTNVKVDGDMKASDSNKRVPVHMRLGILPRKRIIQMPKDVEAAFVNSSSSSDGENVNKKCKRQNIRIVTDVYGSKAGIDFEKKNSEKLGKRCDASQEKSKRLKTHR